MSKLLSLEGNQVPKTPNLKAQKQKTHLTLMQEVKEHGNKMLQKYL